MKNIKEIDNRIYFEDALLTFQIIQTMKHHHDLEVQKAYRHVRVAGFEVDAVLIATTPEGIERWIGFELKATDLPKAIKQAELRRKYFDYFYIIIGSLTVSSVVEYLMDMVKNGKELNGIGYIVEDWKRDILIIKSKFQKRERETIVNGREIPKNQLELTTFLAENTS